MALFKTLPENFFRPLASPLKEHYAALLLIFYRLFLEYQGSIERAQVVREFEDYFRTHAVEAELSDDEVEVSESGLTDEESAESARSPRDVANYFLRRLTAYGWVGNEVLEDFTQLVTMNSWAKPFFEALYSTSTGLAEEYESHIVAVYSLLTGGAARENGHYNLMSAHSHVRRLIESLKVLSQNIRTYLQNLYSEEAEVHEILHIHYDLYMHEVVDRAYNRLKTSDNLSKYRPLINKAVVSFLQDEAWLAANAGRLAVVKRTSVEQARKLMVEMLKEIRDSLRGIDPILDEIDDKNRRYSKISTQKIKTKLYSDASLQGKLRDIVTALAKGSIGAPEVPLQLYRARFLAPESLYTRPRGSRTIEPAAVGVPEENSDVLFRQREMELKVTGQLNPKKVAEFLRGVKFSGHDAEDDTPRGALRSQDIAGDLDGFIKLLYAAGYAEAGRADFPFEVVWRAGDVSVQGFHFQDHYYIERRRGGDGA
ncbi:MAG: DUF5716 family protein [Spirochaetaceae bacterium]|nr:DUF5716 family protein [Spirochaetaceae bacterium]MCF7949380.1 DUF5716 family protein [Spirochaetia bacterium]MCF7950842.1 DUF5716 family protein [Spirochaetaceae bacterium]